MRFSEKRGFILPLALIVFAGVAFAFFVWLSVNKKDRENISPQNSTNVTTDLKANFNANKNSNQNINQSAGECVASGCSGQVCVVAGKEVITTCEYQKWFACLSLTKCERQKDGQCDWTENEAYANCLKEKNPDYKQN